MRLHLQLLPLLLLLAALDHHLVVETHPLQLVDLHRLGLLPVVPLAVALAAALALALALALDQALDQAHSTTAGRLIPDTWLCKWHYVTAGM